MTAHHLKWVSRSAHDHSEGITQDHEYQEAGIPEGYLRLSTTFLDFFKKYLLNTYCGLGIEAGANNEDKILSLFESI